MRNLLSPVMRMRVFYAGLIAVILTALSTATASAATLFPAAVCVPSNSLLSGPFSGPLTSLTGAVGGLMQLLVILVIVLAVVMIIVTALFRNDSARYMQAIALAVGAFIGLPLLISIIVVVRGMFNNMC